MTTEHIRAKLEILEIENKEMKYDLAWLRKENDKLSKDLSWAL